MNYITSNGATSTDIAFSNGSGIYSYSFALKPSEFQPSGSLNFSKLESCQLKFGLLKNDLHQLQE